MEAMCPPLDSRYVVPIRSLFTAALYYYRFPSFSMISLLACLECSIGASVLISALSFFPL